MTWRKPLTRGALLLMESLWVYAILAFFTTLVSSEADRPTLPATIVVVGASFCISRFLQASDLPLGLLRLYGVFFSLLLFYAIVRVDFYADWRFWDFSFADDVFFRTEATLRNDAEAIIGIPLLWLFWLRGVLRGQEYLGFEAVLASFATGIVVIAVVEVFAGFMDMPATVTYLPVPYIAIGLLTIGLAHAARAEDDFGRSFAPTWLAAVGGAVLLLGGFALIFIILDYSATFDLLESGGRNVLWLVAKVVYYVTLPFLWVIEQIFIAVRYLTQSLQNEERARMLGEEPEPPPEEEEDPKGLPDLVRLIVRVVITGSLVTLVLVGVAMVFTRFRRRQPIGEVKESTYQEGRLSADLSDLLSSLLGRFRPHTRHQEDLDAARRLYFDLLAAGEQRGVERQPPETPLELAPRLDGALASGTPRQITRLFDDVRYGDLPAPADELQRLRRELDDLGRQHSTYPA